MTGAERRGAEGVPRGDPGKGSRAKDTHDEKERVPPTIPVPIPCRASTLKNGSCCAAWICLMTRFPSRPVAGKVPVAHRLHCW